LEEYRKIKDKKKGLEAEHNSQKLKFIEAKKNRGQSTGRTEEQRIKEQEKLRK
jgi:hypothetical protein